MKSELSSTMEDYLETIYRIEIEKPAARVRDISKQMGVAKSTVNAALKSLAAKGLIDYAPYELISLTELGRQTASDIVMNHRILHRFLTDVLAIEKQKAEVIACEMEHAADRETMERFCCFLAFVHQSTGKQKRWIDEFRDFVKHGTAGKSCKECIREYLEAMP